MGNDNRILKVGKGPIEIRDALPEDFPEVLRMNQESVHFLSPLTMEKLERLDGESDFHKVALLDGKVAAFCLAFREGANYESVNYQWFLENYEKFLYVDRVVVDLSAQSVGLGKVLYEEVFRYAKESRVPIVTAEIDIQPPNPVSLKFHEKFGFTEVGRQEVYDGEKVVSLQAARIKS